MKRDSCLFCSSETYSSSKHSPVEKWLYSASWESAGYFCTRNAFSSAFVLENKEFAGNIVKYKIDKGREEPAQGMPKPADVDTDDHQHKCQ